MFGVVVRVYSSRLLYIFLLREPNKPSKTSKCHIIYCFKKCLTWLSMFMNSFGFSAEDFTVAPLLSSLLPPPSSLRSVSHSPPHRRTVAFLLHIQPTTATTNPSSLLWVATSCRSPHPHQPLRPAIRPSPHLILQAASSFQ